jgi:hypothetical protein
MVDSLSSKERLILSIVKNYQDQLLIQFTVLQSLRITKVDAKFMASFPMLF